MNEYKIVLQIFLYIPGNPCYIELRQIEKLERAKRKKPRGAIPGRFVTWLIVLIVLSIQPFAYVVGSYTRHDGDNKIEKLLQNVHPLSVGVTRQKIL